MPRILINGASHYYEQAGEGPALAFIHGAFGDGRMWDPQWVHFSSRCRVLRYDLRGHGRTGPSRLETYAMETFADDLAELFQRLGIESAVLCGLSWGGSIAQVFALRHPQKLRALVLVGATAAMGIGFREQLLRYVLMPEFALLLAIRTLRVEDFVRFSFWLSDLALGRDWLSGEASFREYLQQTMLAITRQEYAKIWQAIYGFDLQPLERISCPTLVMTAENDNRMVQHHAAEILRRIPHASRRVLPAAYHALPLEQPEMFNQALEEFLRETLDG